MNNEFIVWDKKSKKWATNSNIKNYLWFSSSIVYKREDSKQFAFFNYVGKTDIEGNKIYADSSIVKVGYGKNSATGVIRWNNKDSLYEFVEVDEDGTEFVMRLYNLKNEDFKIIGTLQENKELLND